MDPEKKDGTPSRPDEFPGLTGISSRSGLAERILDAIPQGFLLLDPQWRIVFSNREVSRISRIPAADLVGKSVWEQWPGLAGSELDVQCRFAVRQQAPVHFEFHFTHPGHELWLEIDAQPVDGGLA